MTNLRTIHPSNFRELMGFNTVALIKNRHGEVVRLLRLTGNGDEIEVDALTEKITVSGKTPIEYEPWFMDRGSLLFPGRTWGERLKIATEGDTIEFLGETCILGEPHAAPVKGRATRRAK